MNDDIFVEKTDGVWEKAKPLPFMCEFDDCDKTSENSTLQQYVRQGDERDGTDWDNDPIFLCPEHGKNHKLYPIDGLIPVKSHKRIVLVAKAASGKDYLRSKFIERGFKPSISITTRPPRENEVDGVDYIFMSKEEAVAMVERDEFYEHVWFNGWLYGTTKDQFENDDIFIMTPSGLALMKPEDRKNSIVIFLDIDESVRRERLMKREMPGDSVDRRLAADEVDFKDFTNYDVRITNPNF